MNNFIPRIYKKEQITIRIDCEKLLQIEALGKKSGISRSEFINQCIEYALDNMVDDIKSDCSKPRNE